MQYLNDKKYHIEYYISLSMNNKLMLDRGTKSIGNYKFNFSPCNYM